MAKVWVLDTETKGTGANMVPLERVLKRPGSDTVPGFVFPERKKPLSTPEPRQPREFKVIDIMSREVLGEGLDARGTVSVLERIHSIVDVSVYVWDPNAERWRMLTFGETRALWAHRGRGKQIAAE